MTQETVMQIFDPSSNKIRMIKSLEIRHYTMPDQKSGEEQSVKGVFFIVVGKNTEWEHWVAYDDFVKLNPDVKI